MFSDFPLAQRIFGVVICVWFVLAVAAGVVGGVGEEWVSCEVVGASFEPGPYEMRMGILDRAAARGWVPGLAASFEEFRAPQ